MEDKELEKQKEYAKFERQAENDEINYWLESSGILEEI